MSNKLQIMILKMLGKDIVTVDWLRRHGAIVGNDVDLYNIKCNSNDATCLEIGDHVTLTGVQLLTHDASLKRFIGNDCNKIGRIVIGNNVFIGVNTVILPNTKIGNNVIIGAGSVVCKNIPDNSVAVGNPAHVICSCEEMVNRHKMRMNDKSIVYTNLKRNQMSDTERIQFNADIEDKVVYIIKK